MQTQQPTETWSMPGTETERTPTYQTPSTAPGTLDQDRELPSTDGTGDEGFIVPDDPAGTDTMGTPGADVEDRSGGGVTPGEGTMPGGSTPGGSPGTTPGGSGTNQPTPGAPPAPGTTPGGGTNPGGTPPGGTNPGGTPPGGGGTSPGGAR